jgi:Pyruvate/2-oxoacid:ferredoxin oxidoreductase delta subunit
MWPRCIVTNFFIIKPTRCTNFTNLFCHETLHVSDSSSVHHQQFIHCTLSNGICHTDTVHTAFRAGPGWNCSSILVLLESFLQTCMTYAIAERTVNRLLMIDELFETRRVSWQNKFVKLVQRNLLRCTVTWTYCHDARSHERTVTMHGHIDVRSRCAVTWTYCHDERSHGRIVTMHGHMDVLSRCTVTWTYCHDARSHERKKEHLLQ